MSAPEPVKHPLGKLDPAVIRAALFHAGAGPILAGRTWIGEKADQDGCLTVYQETQHEDMVIGLAVPAGGDWYLGCTACRTRLIAPPGGKCPACRRGGQS